MSISDLSAYELDDDEDDQFFATIPINEATGEYNFFYEGVAISFPYKAYLSQQQMMETIIKGVNRSEHCLIESPTGTGKTVALLCSLLAWQKFDAERQSSYISPKKFKLDLQEEDHEKKSDYSSYHHQYQSKASASTSTELHAINQAFQIQNQNDILNDPELTMEFESDFDSTQTQNYLADLPTQIISPTDLPSQFLNQKILGVNVVNRPTELIPPEENQNTKKLNANLFSNGTSTSSSEFEESNVLNLQTFLNSSFSSLNGSDSFNGGFDDGPPELKVSPTTIYYATRTIGQITSVVKQLRQTRYASTPMVILASRLQTCINPLALHESMSVDDKCEQLRNPKTPKPRKPNEYPPPSPPSCKYYKNDPTASKFVKFGNTNCEPWDIEDLKKYGHECQSCPYYGIRAIKETAKIVFCTYNHLLCKPVRKASKIEIDSDSILVFDEAHNIEDLCRDIASKKLSLDHLDDLRIEFDKALNGKSPYCSIPLEKKNFLQDLTINVRRLSDWLAHELKPDAEGFIQQKDGKGGGLGSKLYKDLTANVVDTFTNVGFGPSDLKHLWKCFFVMEDKDPTQKVSSEAVPFKIEPKKMRFLQSLLFCLNYLFKRNPKNPEEFLRLSDYKVFLLKFPLSKTSKRHIELHLMCLNPAIAFEDVKTARSVIVASGTLSPIESFSSELHMEFKWKLTAQHVLGPDRIFAAVINRSCESSSRILNFSHRSLYGYGPNDPGNYEHHQNELGLLLLEMSTKVKGGFLVFGSSKSFMEKLKTTWEKNEMLSKLQMQKDIYFEHANGTSFNNMLENYRQSAKDNRGAILFGFIRGRASEGIDFKDDEARLVITVGIPFLPYKDEAIMAKKEYNDRKYKEDIGNPKTALTGKSWYEGTTFRALNQAFGRCVRHSKDWGIVLLVDTRLNEDSYKKYLSSWVKSSLGAKGRLNCGSLQAAKPHIDKFIKDLLIHNSD